MVRDSDSKRRPRRPRRAPGRDSDNFKEKIERDFSREIEMRLAYFLESDEEELELEPMNSYRRRIVHNLAKNYNLTSESRGEDRDRYVCLIKSEDTLSAPPGKAKVRLWDYGSQSFRVNPGENGIRVALKVDGSVEIWREQEKNQIITERLVLVDEFRIRQGRILVPGDPGY